MQVNYLFGCTYGGEVPPHYFNHPRLGITKVSSSVSYNITDVKNSTISLYNVQYLVRISGWAKNSAYISSSDRFSNIVTGNANLVRSIPILSCESIWRIRLFCVSAKQCIKCNNYNIQPAKYIVKLM